MLDRFPFRRAAATLSVVFLALPLLGAAPAKYVPPKGESEKFLEVVKVLASDEMEGRGVGTAGLPKAALYLEAQMKEIGLLPGFDGKYRQEFRIKTGVSMKPGNRLDGVVDGDWMPLGFSSNGSFSGEVAFVGYGIEAPPIGYRELDGLDLKGKVALVLRYEPQEKDDASPFDGKKPSRWSSLRYKAKELRDRGAVAVVFVTGPLQDEGKDKVPALKNDGPESAAGLPIVQVKTSLAQKWLSKAGIDLEKFQKEVDRDLRPRSKGSIGMTLTGKVDLDATYSPAENVMGIIPGSGALAGEILVVGAHYDHLGWGGERSMKPNVKAIHPGADDNASGTSAVLLAASKLKGELAKRPSHRTVAIALFSGEEVGLAGSSWLVDHTPFDIAKVTAMVNLDMVGRLRDEKLVALGAESADGWKEAIDRAASAVGVEVTSKGDGYGPSDQTPFYGKKIPVIHFFTGTHEQYHAPEDTADTINAEGGAKVADLTARLAGEIAGGEAKLAFRRATAAPAMGGDSRGYGAYLGTVPDYRAMESEAGGVLLADVRPGGPADKAGIRGGDRIVKMAGTRIENLYDMTYALQDHKPGETIDVLVIRDGKETTLRATLGERGATPPAAKKEEKPADKSAEAAKPAEPKTETKPAEPKKEAAPAMPADPHSAPPAADAPKGFVLPAFYEGRPGPDFVVKAGKPFERTFEGEKHFKDVRQLTFGGENAEAYWSPDGQKLIFQSTQGGKCDQEFVLDLATGERTRVSDGKGRTTCGYFRWPQQDRIVYASTEAGGAECPPNPDQSMGYVWALYDSYDLWTSNPDGSNAKRLTTTPGYDAEATWCHHGGKMIFTSVRDGDLDLYEMDEAGDVKRLTNTPGYDGGAFYSPDCSEITWRASRPEGKALEEYQALLKKGLIRPKNLEIFVMKSDGTNVRQLTHNGAANFCPYFTVDGKKVVFSSNVGSKDGREFDVWMVSKEGGEPERITTSPGFDGFPMFSPDGRWIVWGSNRADPASHETNVFIARWIE